MEQVAGTAVGEWIYSVEVEDVATALAIEIANTATEGANVGDSVDVAQGDRISLVVTAPGGMGAGTPASQVTVSIAVTPL